MKTVAVMSDVFQQHLKCESNHKLWCRKLSRRVYKCVNKSIHWLPWGNKTPSERRDRFIHPPLPLITFLPTKTPRRITLRRESEGVCPQWEGCNASAGCCHDNSQDSFFELPALVGIVWASEGQVHERSTSRLTWRSGPCWRSASGYGWPRWPPTRTGPPWGPPASSSPRVTWFPYSSQLRETNQTQVLTRASRESMLTYSDCDCDHKHTRKCSDQIKSAFFKRLKKESRDK